MTPRGDWVQVGDRMDWVPAEQPPSPDGGPGRWHVVDGRWEWHPWVAPVVPSPEWQRPANAVVQAQGARAVVAFNGYLVTITRGRRGRETALPLAAITGMLWKPAGLIGLGKIEFLGASLGGEFAYKGTTIATPNNPMVMFNREQQPEFEVLRAAIQSALARC